MNIKRLFITCGSILLGLTIILILSLFGPPILTRAASYTVCTGGPPTCDYISIQSAVDAAGDGDVIKVAADTYTGINNRGGLAQVVYLDKSVTIRGGYTISNWTTSDPIANLTTLDAQGGGRVLYITGNISPTIEGLRITGGDADGLGSPIGIDAGGGVFIHTATAIIRDNQIFANAANSLHNGDGGGVYLYQSDATLDGNTISDNFGNGVFIASYAAKLVNNTIKSNGRGVFLWEIDNATIIGNTISHNTNTGHCGALQSFGDNVTIKDNLITHNSSDGVGGLCVEGNNATIVGNTISFNTSVYGSGGASIGGDVKFIDNTVISNTAGGAGGGLSVSGETGVQTITGNKFSDNSAWEGGAIQLGSSNPILTNNFIVDNTATGYGSAINIWGVPNSQLLHNTIARNSGGDGSGLHIYESTIAMTNNIIADHTVGISVTSDASASLESTLWGDGVWANDTDWAGDGTIDTTANLKGDPDFVDPDAGDYHIGPDSAAIDQGVDAGVTSDIDHHPRPYQEPDIGADEYWPPGALKVIYLPIITR